MHPVTEYATEVVYGNLKNQCCKWEIAACKRHLDDLERQGTDGFPYVFDETRADRIIKWFSLCRHVRGVFQGQPIELQPWQKFDQGSIYGWVNKDTGARRFKRTYNKRARGNVKSTEVSAKCLYHMCADVIYPPGHPEQARYEMNPEVECAAVDKGQAKRVWGDAREMILASPDIRKRMQNKSGNIPLQPPIQHCTRGGFMRPLSKDTKNKDSGAPCYFDVDEYHAHTTSEIYDIGLSGFGKRAQSLLDVITTAGSDAENSPCKKEEEYAKKVLSGESVDETYFIMIREIEDDDDPHDKTCWVKANPILRYPNEYSATLLEQIELEYNAAYQSGEYAKIFNFLTRRMDRWQASAEHKYFADCMDKWHALAIPRDEFLELIKGRECFNGEDLSRCVDLTASGYVFRLDDGRYAVTAHGFIPEESVKKHERSDRIPYRYYAENNWCTIINGSVIDDRDVISHIHDMEFDNGWKMKEICCDPYTARQFLNVMGADGEGYTTVEVRQGFVTLSEPTTKLRELVLQGLIVHDGSPLLDWCLSNAVEEQGGGGLIKLSKKNKDDTQRIDLAAAIINALFRALLLDAAPASVYERRGMHSLL